MHEDVVIRFAQRTLEASVCCQLCPVLAPVHRSQEVGLASRALGWVIDLRAPAAGCLCAGCGWGQLVCRSSKRLESMVLDWLMSSNAVSGMRRAAWRCAYGLLAVSLGPKSTSGPMANALYAALWPANELTARRRLCMRLARSTPATQATLSRGRWMRAPPFGRRMEHTTTQKRWEKRRLPFWRPRPLGGSTPCGRWRCCTAPWPRVGQGAALRRCGCCWPCWTSQPSARRVTGHSVGCKPSCFEYFVLLVGCQMAEGCARACEISCTRCHHRAAQCVRM